MAKSLQRTLAEKLPALIALIESGGLSFDLEAALDGVGAALVAGATATDNGFGVTLDDANNRIAVAILNVVKARAALGLTIGIAAGNIAVLDANGKFPASTAPAVSLGESFTVANQAAMLALNAQIGDVAIRSDQADRKYLLLGANPATLGDWSAVNDPAGAVSLWAGLGGNITLAAAVAALANDLMARKTPIVPYAASTVASAADAEAFVAITNAAAVSYTIPLNATWAAPIGTSIVVQQAGAGQVTFVATGGVTFEFPGGKLKTDGQFAQVTLLKKAVNTWSGEGRLIA